jgi:hypothetical protein
MVVAYEGKIFRTSRMFVDYPIHVRRLPQSPYGVQLRLVYWRARRDVRQSFRQCYIKTNGCKQSLEYRRPPKQTYNDQFCEHLSL